MLQVAVGSKETGPDSAPVTGPRSRPDARPRDGLPPLDDAAHGVRDDRHGRVRGQGVAARRGAEPAPVPVGPGRGRRTRRGIGRHVRDVPPLGARGAGLDREGAVVEALGAQEVDIGKNPGDLPRELDAHREPHADVEGVGLQCGNFSKVLPVVLLGPVEQASSEHRDAQLGSAPHERRDCPLAERRPVVYHHAGGLTRPGEARHSVALRRRCRWSEVDTPPGRNSPGGGSVMPKVVALVIVASRPAQTQATARPSRSSGDRWRRSPPGPRRTARSWRPWRAAARGCPRREPSCPAGASRAGGRRRPPDGSRPRRPAGCPGASAPPTGSGPVAASDTPS
jgi:hypothetical protein